MSPRSFCRERSRVRRLKSCEWRSSESIGRAAIRVGTAKLENALYVHRDPDRALLLAGFRLTLNRCDPNVPGSWGTTILHAIAASRGGLTADDRLSFAIPVLDAGGRLDLRDNLLKSTPLGWACRWGRIELVRLFLERGADPIEADAEPWATPRAWAEKMNHAHVLAVLR